MRKLLLLSVFCLLFIGCRNKNTINIPDQVEVSKMPAMECIPGTRLWVQKPVGYTFIKETGRFQKNEHTVLQASEAIGVSYDVQIATIKNGLEQNIRSGIIDKPFYKREFMLGGYNAILIYGHDTKPGIDQLFLAFGAETFVVMATGEFKAGNTGDRDTLLKTLLSMYFENRVQLDSTANTNTNYTVDVSGTDFKYIGTSNQCDFYTLPGEGLPNDNPFQDIIFVRSFDPMNYESIKNFADNMVNGYRNSILINEMSDKQIMFNGDTANEVSFRGVLERRECVAYQLVVSNSHHTVLFFGTAFNRRDELMKQIRTIANSLKIKD